MTLPNESRDDNWRSQDIWSWLVHPTQIGGWYCQGGSVRTTSLPPKWNRVKTKNAKFQVNKEILAKRLIVLNIRLLYHKVVCVVDSFTYKVRAVVVVVPQMLFFFFKFVRVKPIAKVIYPKYSKNWPYTLAHTIDFGCSKMLNHGLNHRFSLSLFKLIPCPMHWIVWVLAHWNFIFKGVFSKPSGNYIVGQNLCFLR